MQIACTPHRQPAGITRQRIGGDEIMSSLWTGTMPSLITPVTVLGKRYLAYILALLLPGAGHAYAGHWRRGLVWFVLCIVTLAFLSTGVLLVERTGAEPFVVTALRLETVGFADVAFPLAVLVLSVLDLYGLAVLDEKSVEPPVTNRS